MKKRRKHILIIGGGLIAVVAAAALIYMWPMFSMEPYPTSIVIGTDIISVQNNKNSLYFIPSGDDSYIAVDAGSNEKQIKETMQEQEIDPRSVSHVLLTHTDSDHIAALSLFSKAEIIISKDEEKMIDGSTKRNFIQKNNLSDEVKSRLTYIGEEELSIAEHKIACYKAPGHTTGSMAFLVDDTYLFTGDALGLKNGQTQIHPYTMDNKAAQDSIEKLLDINKDILIFTAHYGVYPISEISR